MKSLLVLISLIVISVSAQALTNDMTGEALNECAGEAATHSLNSRGVLWRTLIRTNAWLPSEGTTFEIDISEIESAPSYMGQVHYVANFTVVATAANNRKARYSGIGTIIVDDEGHGCSVANFSR